MGSEIVASHGAERRDDFLWFKPEALTLVTDKNHPLYDERVHLPLDESLVLNIMRRGVMQAIIIRKNGTDKEGKPVVEVVAGRQRVRAAAEANKRLTAEGKKPILVPAMRRREDITDLFGVMISENEIRQGDAPITKARKLSRYLAMGGSEEAAAIDFGVTQQTVKNLLKLLDLHPDVQKAIEKDNLPTNIAKEFAPLPQEEQSAALAVLVASGEVKGARGVEAAKRVRNGGKATSDKVRMMNRPALEEWKKRLSKGEGKDCEIAYAVVTRILGGERALSNYPRLKGTLEVEEAK